MAKRSLKRLFSTGNRVEEAATFPTSRANGIFVHSPKPVCEETGFQLDWREKDETGTKKASFSRNKHGGAEVKKKKENNFSSFSGQNYEGQKQLFCHGRIKDSLENRRETTVSVFPKNIQFCVGRFHKENAAWPNNTHLAISLCVCPAGAAATEPANHRP